MRIRFKILSISTRGDLLSYSRLHLNIVDDRLNFFAKLEKGRHAFGGSSSNLSEATSWVRRSRGHARETTRRRLRRERERVSRISPRRRARERSSYRKGKMKTREKVGTSRLDNISLCVLRLHSTRAR